MSVEQIAIEAVPCRRWEVVIAGAGPAGSVCAWTLAEHGHEVLIVDKERFPRHKPCGDLLIADSISILDRIGLIGTIKNLAHEVPAMDVYSPSGIRITIPGSYLAVRRRELDMALITHACHKRQRGGVTFGHGKAVDIKVGKDGGCSELYCYERSDPILAKILVLATGGVVTLPYRQGLVSNKKPDALALRGYIRSHYRLDNAIISYERSVLPCYLWIIPLGKDADGLWVYNAGCGTSYRTTKNGQHRLKKTLTSFLNESPLARPVMEMGEGLTQVQGAPLRSGLRDTGSACKKNLVAVGEVIGTTYPFLGEGIGKAMESGYIAAMIIHDALQSGDLSCLRRYPSQLETLLKPRYRGYVKAEKWLAHAWLNDFVARRISKSGYLQEKVQQLLAETQDPRAVFGLGGLLRSYWK